MFINITVEVSHVEGKFIARDELVEALIDELTGIGTLSIEESEYEIGDAFEAAPQPKGAA